MPRLPRTRRNWPTEASAPRSACGRYPHRPHRGVAGAAIGESHIRASPVIGQHDNGGDADEREVAAPARHLEEALDLDKLDAPGLAVT